MVQAKRSAKNKQASNTNISDPNSYENVRKIVLRWPTAMRTALAHDILDTFASQEDLPQEESPRPRRKTLHLALGILNTGRTPPTDEEVQEMIDEYRMEKYGR